MGGFSVLNNLAGLVAQQQSNVNQMNLQKTLYRLSSGARVNRGGDDAAGLAIADGLSGQIRTLQQSVRNANDGIGFIQVADSALGQVSNLLNRAASLLTQAASDTNSAGQSAIETELAQIYQEIDSRCVHRRYPEPDSLECSSLLFDRRIEHECSQCRQRRIGKRLEYHGQYDHDFPFCSARGSRGGD